MLEKEFGTGEDAKQYEQMITLYGTAIVKAGSKEEAEEKIKEFLDKLTWGENRVKGMEDIELIIGEYEREDEVKEMDNYHEEMQTKNEYVCLNCGVRGSFYTFRGASPDGLKCPICGSTNIEKLEDVILDNFMDGDMP